MTDIRKLGETIKSPHKSRLFVKNLKFILPVLVFSIAITAMALSWTSYRSFRETVRQDYNSIIKSSAGEIRAFLEGSKSRMEDLALVLAATKADPWQQQMALTAFRHVSPQFESLWLIPQDEGEVISAGQILTNSDPMELEVYRHALTGRMAISPVMVTKERLPYIWIATPVFELDKVSPVLLAELNLKAIWDVLEGIHVGKTGMVYILDASGKLVGHREMDRVVNALPGVTPELMEKLQQSQNDPINWSESREGESYYSLGYPVAGTGCFIVLTQKEREIYGHLYDSFWLALAITLLVGLATVALTWSRVRDFLLPIRTLHRQVQRIGRGELDERVLVQSDDEIGELAKAFNDMADSLKQHIEREVVTARELVHARNLATLGATSSKVTHEVGNFLNTTGAALQLLKNEPLSLGSRKALEILDKDAERVKTFIQNLLQFAKKPELNLQRMSLEVPLREVLFMARSQADNKGIEVLLDWPPDLPHVNVDLNLIYQVLNNLVKNSLEAITEQGRIEITASTAGDYLQVKIADTGPGISPDVIDRIFDPFFTTKGKIGTGLGLSICKTIVEAHRGSIDCESEPGKGTTSTIRLPALY
jgi:signal transduction histidine kinase